jgi:hypothetical protein
MTDHPATVRPGIVGPGEPGHRVFEGNFVIECPCGMEMHCASSQASAEQQRAHHERTGR